MYSKPRAQKWDRCRSLKCLALPCQTLCRLVPRSSHFRPLYNTWASTRCHKGIHPAQLNVIDAKRQWKCALPLASELFALHINLKCLRIPTYLKRANLRPLFTRPETCSEPFDALMLARHPVIPYQLSSELSSDNCIVWNLSRSGDGRGNPCVK
jgi:hypothetical protein